MELNPMESGRQKNDSDFRPKTATLPIQKKCVYIDEALSRTKFGKFNYFLILVSGIVLLAATLETCGVGYILPVCQCELNLATNQKGILASVGFLGIICSSHLWGYLADTKGRRCIIQPTLMITFILSVCSSLTNNFYIFATLRFFNGFFISGSSATILAYSSEFHDNNNQGRVIMATALVYGILLPFVPLTAYYVINQDWQYEIPMLDVVFRPWRLYLIVLSLPALLSSIALWFSPESPKFVLSQGDQITAIEIINKVNRYNNGRKATLDIVEIYEEAESIENRQRILNCKDSCCPLFKSIWIQTAPLFQQPHLGSIALISTIQFCIFYISNGFFIFFPEIVNRIANSLDDFVHERAEMCDTLNMNRIENASEFLTANGTIKAKICVTKLEPEAIEMGIVLEILYTVAFGIIYLLINKVGKFSILFIVLFGGGFSVFGCMLTDIPFVQIGLLMVFVTVGVASNIINTSTVNLFPTTLRAMAVCISLMFGRLGGVAGSNITAALLDYHCKGAFYLPGIALVVCAFLTYFIPNIHKTDLKPTPAEQRISIISIRR